MDTTVVNEVLYDALVVVIKLSSPMLLLGLIVGVAIAIFQAVTQIHEQTLGFILKLIVIVVTLLIGGGWMMQNLQEYTMRIFALIAA